MMQSSASWQACRLELSGRRGDEDAVAKKDVQLALGLVGLCPLSCA